MSIRLEPTPDPLFFNLVRGDTKREIIGWIQEKPPGIIGRALGKKSLFLYGTVASTNPVGDAPTKDWALALLLAKLRSDPKFGG